MYYTRGIDINTAIGGYIKHDARTTPPFVTLLVLCVRRASKTTRFVRVRGLLSLLRA